MLTQEPILLGLLAVKAGSRAHCWWVLVTIVGLARSSGPTAAGSW